jgi:hypothetical protein
MSTENRGEEKGTGLQKSGHVRVNVPVRALKSDWTAVDGMVARSWSGFQNPWFFILTALAFTSAVIIQNLPPDSHSHLWETLTNGYPKRGELGY